MANTKSAIKAARKTVRLTSRNQTVQTRLKTMHKKFEQAVAANDAAAAKAAGAAYASAIDRAAKKGVVHKNAANHVKRHVSKFVLAKA